MARAALFEPVDPSRSAADLVRAIELDPSSWRARHALTAFHLRQGRKDEALAAARRAVADHPAEVPLQVDLAEALLASGDPYEAARVLDRISALPYEGASDIHGLFVRAHVAIGLEAMRRGAWADAIDALELAQPYPEELGTGAPFDPDLRMQDHLISRCLDRIGERDKAAALREAIRVDTLANGDKRRPHDYFGGLVLEKLGRREDRLRARELLGRRAPAAEVLRLLRDLGARR